VAEIPQGTVRTDDSELITPRSSATVVVYRRIGPQYEYLVLHRAHYGPDFAGAWAWGPPSGTRQPDEDVDQCAAREVFEETGLRLTLQPVGRGPWDGLVTSPRPPRMRRFVCHMSTIGSSGYPATRPSTW
jgi:8-oxo-dGTP pyrophosphatase MutT (NUDIX family)